MTSRTRKRLVSLLLTLSLGGLVAGCGGGDSAGASSGAQAAKTANDAQARSGAGSGPVAATPGAKAPAGAKAGSSSSSVDVTGAATRRVRTAQLTLEVKKLADAAEQVRTTAVTFGGVVSAEKSGFTTAGEAVITVRVPEARLDDALTGLAKIGKEIDRSAASHDVTSTIADLDSRVGSQAASVARVRKLMGRAETLPDIVLLESELSRREADLESLQAQQRALSDQAALSTVTVTLRTPRSTAAVAIVEARRDDGFLAGLRQGWHAVTASTTVVLTVVGALLPVAVALTVIGWPAFLLHRRFAPVPDDAPGRPARQPTKPTPNPGPAPDTP
jgi:hypothetical protein